VNASLEGRLVLVTGGSRGIGAAIARLAAERGAMTVVNYRHDEAAAGRVVDEIRVSGGRAEAIRADVADQEAVRTMFRTIRESWGDLDVLVNNAGVMTGALLAMTPVADFDVQMNVNARGTFLCMQHAAKQMTRRGAGRIVNLSSVVGRYGARGRVAYAASKAAVIGMTLAAARELGPSGITVNAVAPGLIDTDMTVALSAELRREILESTPLGRAGTASEVARLVVWLASDEAGFVNGQVLGIDGGQVP
jgi:3-oxoacyl-[acyl-carrier protein] reductase